MTDTDLHDQLTARTAGLTMTRPAAELVARGDRIRRRRRTATWGGVAGLAAAGVLGASALAPPGSSPLAPPAAYAAWGPAMVNLEPSVAAGVGATCARELGTFGFDVAAVDPVAADTRAGETVAVYRVGTRYGFCSLHGDAGGTPQPAGAVVGRLRDLRAGTHLAPLGATVSQPGGPASSAEDAVGALHVSPAVDRVAIEVGGTTFDAAVGHGFAMFWLPDGLAPAEVDAARATAYDAAGDVLSSTSAL